MSPGKQILTHLLTFCLGALVIFQLLRSDGDTPGLRRLQGAALQQRSTSEFGKWLIQRNAGNTYDTYIKLQRNKLKEVPRKIIHIDKERQRQLEIEMGRVTEEKTAGITTWQKKSVLCLGARLGGEVRAFKALGALAIGIDLNPGEGSMDAVSGDFHNILFPEGSFDFAFSNVLDHVFNVDKFAGEVHRVLAPGGIFMAALFPEANDKWNGPEGVSIQSRKRFTRKMEAAGLTLRGETMKEFVFKFPPELTVRTWNNKILTLFFVRDQ